MRACFLQTPRKPHEKLHIRPTADHLAKLKELNQAQADADAASRELAALQQELYARWWKVCAKSHSMRRDDLADEKAECEKIVERVKSLRTTRDGALGRVRTVHAELKGKLPKEELANNQVKELLELKYDAAPRFWTPADPVVVLKNCGLPTKHQFPPEHPCRLPEEIVTAAEVKVGQETKPFRTPAGVNEIAAAAQKLPACPELADLRCSTKSRSSNKRFAIWPKDLQRISPSRQKHCGANGWTGSSTT